GHPEYWCTPGVETTTGPLGAGFANAVGMAIAEEMLASIFNTSKHKIFDHYTYVLAGDGCMMEGVSSEAASLAGHLGLGKLIVFYDSNKITIEGSTELTFTEDVLGRFKAYGWQTLSADAYDVEGIHKLVEEAKAEKNKPSIILVKSVIGKGSPNLAGSHKVHGAPLGKEEVIAARKNLGIPENENFYVHPNAIKYFAEKKNEWKRVYDTWQATYMAWKKENPELKRKLDQFYSNNSSYLQSVQLPDFPEGTKMATRAASGKVLNALAAALPNLVGGSADLAPSNNTAMPDYMDFSRENRKGRTLHFGVREHAMGSITNGIWLHGGLRAFCATFLVFADYMRPSIRLAALMKLPVIYIFTHDSIYVGEDGPTHQPVETLASLRVIPNLVVLRPGDAQETALAWTIAAGRTGGPTALALTRQNLEVYPKADKDWKHTALRGAYIVKDCEGRPDVIVVATGSEVNLALKAAGCISDKKVRIVSMLSRELFYSQDDGFTETILPKGIKTVAVEAGVSFGWERVASGNNAILSINRFGESGPAEEVAEHLGLTVAALIEKIRN
ncbi:MAG: transketolase, partial [Spirochaetota bacterium]